MDFAFINPSPIKSSTQSIAIIGAGIAGLSCAGYLSTAGHAVTVFERLSVAGGLMSYGIPEWRIPQEHVQEGVDRLQKGFNVQFEFSTKIIEKGSEQNDVGDLLVKHTRTVEEIRSAFDIVVVATGAWGERNLGLEGESLSGVFGGIDFLYRVRAQHYAPEVELINVQSQRVVIIGAGFTAIDVATRALQLGASSVSIVYRRTSKEAPAGLYEIEHVINEGVIWVEQHTPIAILGTEHVEAVRFHDASTDSDVDIPCDVVIKAVGDIPHYPYEACKEIAKEKIYTPKMAEEHLYIAGDALIGASKLGKAARNGLQIARRVLTDLEHNKGTSFFDKKHILSPR